MIDHPMKGIEEEDGFVIDHDEKNRFMCARKGDYFVTMFQCEQCRFQNIKGKDPCRGTVDEKLLQYIRRANLDAFWSRESSTGNASQQELRRDIRLGQELGLEVDKAFPKRGLFPLEDFVGMGQAVIMLKRTQMPGKTGIFVQYNTIRKHRRALSNFWHTSPYVMTTA